ncbi:hypothetical protein, partial [Cronobacter malonaticus]|uniref:hypothetical protein n=1 Tax=Cronobacter malonaticus TaxID=413503 RepID=UPI001F218E2A
GSKYPRDPVHPETDAGLLPTGIEDLTRCSALLPAAKWAANTRAIRSILKPMLDYYRRVLRI